MNNVFEIFTNIRCGWGSSLWKPEMYSTFSIWTNLNKSYSLFCLLQCLTATPDVEINSLSLLSSFSLSWCHLFPILGPGDEVWKICWTLLSSSQREVLGHTSRSGMQYLYDTCFPQSPYLLVGMRPPKEIPLGETKPAVQQYLPIRWKLFLHSGKDLLSDEAEYILWQQFPLQSLSWTHRVKKNKPFWLWLSPTQCMWYTSYRSC